MSNSRNVYLKMNTLVEAREILFASFSRLERLSGEAVFVPDAVGRVLAEPVFAKLSSPNFHAAAMDGIAVKAEDTFGASETSPKKLAVNKNAFFLNTGHVLPKDTNAVIMIEYVNAIDENVVEIEVPAVPWQHVRKMGEDIVATELLFARNHVVTPYCVGALLSGGIFSVLVRKKPKAIIIPTGSELVDWENANIDELKPGQIYETNSFVLGKLIESCGGIYEKYNKIIDNTDKIKEALLDALHSDCDLVLILGGSSAGSEDYAKKVISETGEVFVHGVTMMPGKPVVIGKVKNKPVFGIPGYPVSAIVAFEQLVQPIIYKLLGQSEKERQKIQVIPAKKITSKLGLEEFVRVKLGKVGERVIATTLPRGAGCITTITEADGIIRIPNHIEGINAQEPVTAELLRPLSLIDNTIVVVGSHDNSLDILSDSIKAGQNSLTLSSSHVGSMGGLMAIKNGVCHIAGSHLLDTIDGSYNISYIKKYLPDTKVKLVHLVFRDQGLIVAKGNPKNIKGIKDLARSDISFINRQGGSGTRILLDYRLNQAGIDPKQITGYFNEEFTHMSVAVAVLSGAVDVGLGIFAAAKALGLDFIPVVTEQYDLVIPEVYFETKNIQILLDTINSTDFKKRVEALGGYSTKETGNILL
ncbi:MAG: molybdopterin biosynthesis protein [Desulfobacterium sp.]|nr:molybdopterin biosynthesis protein [Desulfobacterium sp.]MBU3948582.1 molybdopterin biosynthesis protein [Pseudomonadota bacterium]MBU4009865.1 molybdopterin biosynthesis protein [Pseudomonadota bacterium]MBU4035784.1 molybdopterin biosynthesis protein [Pseudomonadota bacterium]